MSTQKLTFDAAAAVLGRLYDGEPLAPIAAAAGMSERALLQDLRSFTAELCELVNAARTTVRAIPVNAHGALHGLAEVLPPGTKLVPRGEL